MDTQTPPKITITIMPLATAKVEKEKTLKLLHFFLTSRAGNDS